MSLVACTFIGNTPQLNPDKAARIRVHISDFRNRKEKRGEFFETETMMAHGYPWKIRIYPRGIIKAGSDAVADDVELVFCVLICASDAHDRKEFPVDAKATVRANNSCVAQIDRVIHDMGSPFWLHWNDACKEEVLTIDVDICVDKKRKTTWYPTKALKDFSCTKLRKLHSSSESSDVTFIVGSTRKEFNGHKCILEISSPYLHGLVLSKAEEIDDVDDVDTAVEGTCETAEHDKSEEEGISSDGFVPVSSVTDGDDDVGAGGFSFGGSTTTGTKTSAIGAGGFSFGGKSNTTSTSSSGGFKFETTSNVTSDDTKTSAPARGEGSASMAKVPPPSSTFPTSSESLFSKTSSSPSNVNIELPGVDEVAFEALFKFLYTGIEPNHIRGEENSAAEMLVLANQFDCTHLKLYAESVLAERFLDTSNAADKLLFADAHSCALLKEAAMGMYATDPKTVKKTEGYVELMKSKDLVIELLEYISGERGEYIRVADCTPEEDVDNLDVTSLRERLQSVSIHNVDGSKEMLVKYWKDAIV
ncbi:hypothetical protein FRACYDRAFT_231869 [Fragilariopsis cylindrus CCMP1102]|uniref:BTB domain-containing protein n=1 Tax=Fragilariopsis cylindrus CCMP1102 TaxID=635003 RepID=A0A1E7FUD9_9STRA|nr:hypothetical protein FRACYDRAFT_231869 [Fragilariopsis cylindrus CCMP1102]|eukprot:OEU21725.1 hypothetical protein FRACYDRAFT_231869 [Fragilariopsis cylindrus CCMP1102]